VATYERKSVRSVLSCLSIYKMEKRGDGNGDKIASARNDKKEKRMR